MSFLNTSCFKNNHIFKLESLATPKVYIIKELRLFTLNIDRRLSLLKGETSERFCRGSGCSDVSGRGVAKTTPKIKQNTNTKVEQ